MPCDAPVTITVLVALILLVLSAPPGPPRASRGGVAVRETALARAAKTLDDGIGAPRSMRSIDTIVQWSLWAWRSRVPAVGIARLLSVNVGLPRDIQWQGRTVRTAIWKQPVAGRCRLRQLNLDGDRQGDSSG